MVAEGNRVSQCTDAGNYGETSNRASWNELQKAHLVELLVEFHQPGARKQNGWSSAAWNDIRRRINAKFSNTNFSLTQIKEQEHTLKKQYKTIQRLRNQPGFGWDITTNMVTAPEDVWSPLLKDKEIKRWYNKPFPYYDALHKVYCGFIATGKRKRRSNYFTNNEVEFEPTIPTIHDPREQPHFDAEDDFLNTQGDNSPISTQPNLHFAQEPSPIQPSISASRRDETQLICASIEKKSIHLTQTLHIEEWPPHKLVFANQVPQSIYTRRKITDNDGMPIQIQLIGINTGRQCTNMEGLNIKVDIVVIDGDLEQQGLDSDKFNSKIVKQREGKSPLLVGNTKVTFNQQGVGTTGDIRFTDNSSWLRSRKFRLGACIDSMSCGTNIKIQEGLSEKFVVKDQRGLSYEKHYPPMLNDDVWRLKSIAKNGIYHQRLKEKNIKSVQDFLKLLNENPIVLKEEILDMQLNAWKKVVKHAQTCPVEPDHANLENNADLPSDDYTDWLFLDDI